MTNALSLWNDMIWSRSIETYPRYNIVKVDSGTLIEIAVPGREKEDIEVTLEDDRLKIHCAKLSSEETENYLHKGISGKGFDLQFFVSRATEVKEVKLKNGLLSIFVGKPKQNPLRIEVQS